MTERTLLVAVVVEQVWDPFSIEFDVASRNIDWSRAAAVPSPGSVEAVELGLRLGDVSAYGLGVDAVSRLLRLCLAMGASRAVETADVYTLAEALRHEQFDIVLAPQRSGDQGASPLAPSLAGLLDLPQATGVEALRVAGPEAIVVRRMDRGVREELAVPLPAVVALEPGIVRPRAATPSALIAAQTADIAALPPSPLVPRIAFRGYEPPRPPPPRMQGPDPSLPAEARIAAVVGTSSDSRQRELVTGSPTQVAERIAQLLEERGYVSLQP